MRCVQRRWIGRTGMVHRARMSNCTSIKCELDVDLVVVDV